MDLGNSLSHSPTSPICLPLPSQCCPQYQLCFKGPLTGQSRTKPVRSRRVESLGLRTVTLECDASRVMAGGAETQAKQLWPLYRFLNPESFHFLLSGNVARHTTAFPFHAGPCDRLSGSREGGYVLPQGTICQIGEPGCPDR